MTVLDIEVRRTRDAVSELDFAVERLNAVSDALGRAEGSAKIGGEVLDVSRSLVDATDDVRRLARLLDLVADRVEHADNVSPGFYDGWINGLVSTIRSAPTTGARGRRTFRRHRDWSATLGSPDRDEIGQPTLASYGQVAGVLFVSDPAITIAGTTTTSPVGLPPGDGASQSIPENGRFEAEIGRSVPIDSGTHFGRNAAACNDDPLACHGEVTSDEFFAVLGFVPVVGEVIDSAFCAGGDNVSCASIIVPLAGGKAVRLTADSFRAGSRATDNFRITNKRWRHITDRHVAGGREATLKKSTWLSEGDIVTHIGNARTWSTSHFSRGNTVIVADAGVTVGHLAKTRQPTSMYTVVVSSTGEIVTAHPGLPQELAGWS